MNPVSNSFPFCNTMSYAILIQFIICLFIQTNTCPYINRVVYFRSACARTQFLPPHFQAHTNYIKCTLKSQAFCIKEFRVKRASLLRSPSKFIIRYSIPAFFLFFAFSSFSIHRLFFHRFFYQSTMFFIRNTLSRTPFSLFFLPCFLP